MPSPIAGLLLVQTSDLVGVLPGRIGSAAIESLGLATFALPLEVPPLVISMAWHPRHDADGGHRWLRDCVREAV